MPELEFLAQMVHFHKCQGEKPCRGCQIMLERVPALKAAVELEAAKHPRREPPSDQEWA